MQNDRITGWLWDLTCFPVGYTRWGGLPVRLVILLVAFTTFEVWIDCFELKNLNLKIKTLKIDPKSDLKK